MGLINFQLRDIWDFIRFLINVSPSKQIRKVVNIYDALHRGVESTNIDRVLVLKAHNGGGLIRPDTPLYITALYEDYKSPLSARKDEIQRLMIDSEYIKLLLEICTRRVVPIMPPSVPPSILRTALDSDEARYTEFFFLGQDRKNLYFCLIITTRESEIFSAADQRAEINLMVNSLRNNIK